MKPRTKRLNEMTADERAEFEAEVQKRMAGMSVVCIEAKARGLGKGKGGYGEMKCPMEGCTGRVRFSVASYNGHIHGACNVEGCLSWMQ